MSLAIIMTLLLCGAVSAEAPPNSLTPRELAGGWILLFDGSTTFGWKAASDADWKVVDGAISVTRGESGLLATTSEFADFVLKVDFRSHAGTNSGIFLRTSTTPKDPTRDCYELNIAEPSITPFPTGSFVGRTKGATGPLSDGWHTYEITAEGGRFHVRLDGQQVLDYLDPEPLRRGAIGLQFNKGPVEFRNIKLCPLRLATIFNGRDLNGWTIFPGKQSVASVTPAGELHLENGPGQLESLGRYADFIFQADIFLGGKGLNSGIFFRCIPGEFAQGYESQIHNVYSGGDRTKPVDCGTGGFYRRQNARRVVADDFQWFHKTLVVSGPHMAAWVNGYQVSDWTDRRKPDANPRRGLRLQAGTLAIQGHDPSTKLALKRVRMVELPGR